MCTGSEVLMMSGQVAGGLARQSQGEAKASLSRADALYVQDAASQQAEKILRAGQREKGSARAATAASGTRIDQFSTLAEREIDTLSGQDAAMAILTGKNKARSMEFSGDMSKRAGDSAMYGSLFGAAKTDYSGWKNSKGKPDPAIDFYLNGTQGAGD